MKLTKDEMDNMIGVAGLDANSNKIPKRTVNNTVVYDVLGQRRGIPGTNKYAGINHGERWNEDNWQQIIVYASKSNVISTKQVKPEKVEKSDEQDG